MVQSLVYGREKSPKTLLRLICVLCTFCENQEINRVGRRLTCGQSVNCKPMMFLQPSERRASQSVNVSHKSLLLPGWALRRIYSCSLSSALPAIITLELEHKHLATLATCKENVPFVYLRQKHIPNCTSNHLVLQNWTFPVKWNLIYPFRRFQ